MKLAIRKKLKKVLKQLAANKSKNNGRMMISEIGSRLSLGINSYIKAVNDFSAKKNRNFSLSKTTKTGNNKSLLAKNDGPLMVSKLFVKQGITKWASGMRVLLRILVGKIFEETFLPREITLTSDIGDSNKSL